MKITYQKWWHRFIPKYRRQIKTLNALFKYYLKNGLEEKVAKVTAEAMIYGSAKMKI